MAIERLTGIIRSGINYLHYKRVYRTFQRFTMIPEREYIDNLRLARRAATVNGCIIECGTWRGGMIAGIANVLGSSRRYYLFDSFEGLPPATPIDGAAALAWQGNKDSSNYYNNCTASEKDARDAMNLSGVSQYDIVKGWFSDTLPKVRLAEPVAVLRLDADWYESTVCALDNLASHVAPGGMIIVDDV